MTTEIIRYIHMASIALMLSSYSFTLPTPSKTAFFMHGSIESNNFLQWEHDSRVKEPNLPTQDSRNEESITKLSPH